MRMHGWIAGIAVIIFLGATGAVIAASPQKTLPQTTDISSLIKTASDPKSDVTSTIRSVLLLAQEPQNPVVQNGFIELFKSHYDPTHTLAAVSIGYVKNKSLTEQIVPFLRSTNAWERRDAAWVLGRDIGNGKKFVEQLVAMLNDSHWQVREYAAWAVGRYEAKEALPLLRNLAQTRKGYRDGSEAEEAIDAIEHGAYRPRISAPAPWIIVPDVDIPWQEIYDAKISKLKGHMDVFLFGLYKYVNPEGQPPLAVAILGQTQTLIFYGGEGQFTDVWTKTTVTVSGEHCKRVAKEDVNQSN
jgi:hypothetical protein